MGSITRVKTSVIGLKGTEKNKAYTRPIFKKLYGFV